MMSSESLVARRPSSFSLSSLTQYPCFATVLNDGTFSITAERGRPLAVFRPSHTSPEQMDGAIVAPSKSLKARPKSVSSLREIPSRSARSTGHRAKSLTRQILSSETQQRLEIQRTATILRPAASLKSSYSGTTSALSSSQSTGSGSNISMSLEENDDRICRPVALSPPPVKYRSSKSNASRNDSPFERTASHEVVRDNLKELCDFLNI